MCNTFLKSFIINLMILVCLSGCVFDEDADVLNRANQREIKLLKIKNSLLCYDVDRNPHMEGWIVEVNEENYQCVITDVSSKWVKESELLNAL